MRLLGEAVSLSGLVYGGLFQKSIHVIPPFYDSLSDKDKQLYYCLCGIDAHTNTPTAMVFMLIDRDNNCYVDRCSVSQADTDETKHNWWRIVIGNKYRMGYSVCDKSADSTNIALSRVAQRELNIFKELQRHTCDANGRIMINGIKSLIKSEKYEGSINAGIDELKKRLKEPERLFIIDRPENKELIRAFMTMERDRYKDESKGLKDRIKEGMWHLHSALRFIFQFSVRYVPLNETLPQPYREESYV